MPSCDCNPGFYNSGTNAACIACTYPCDNCTGPTTCTTCQNPANRVSVSNCDCQPNYFDNGTNCE